MNEVRAWQADDGSLHATEEDAAVASILHLAQTAATNVRGAALSATQARFIVDNRAKIRNLLWGLDNKVEPHEGWVPPAAKPPKKGDLS